MRSLIHHPGEYMLLPSDDSFFSPSMVSKELYNLWLHVDPTYDTRRIEGASTEGQLQHKSR